MVGAIYTRSIAPHVSTLFRQESVVALKGLKIRTSVEDKKFQDEIILLQYVIHPSNHRLMSTGN